MHPVSRLASKSRACIIAAMPEHHSSIGSIRARFVGVGGAFEPAVGNSALWLPDFHGENVLLDCGFTVYPKLAALGLDGAVDALLVTHLHADHVGSLTNLVFANWFRNQRRTRIYDPGEPLREELLQFLRLQLRQVDRFVEIVPLPADRSIQVFDTFGDHVPGMPTVGYLLNTPEGPIAYSGDTGNPARVFAAIEASGIKPALVLHEMCFEPQAPAHTHYELLYPWMETFQIAGYHCAPDNKPADCKIPLAAELGLLL